MYNLKITILFFYYNRPRTTEKYCLKSVVDSTYVNWELCVIDDSDEQNFDEVLDDFMEGSPDYEVHRPQIKIYPTGDDDEAKKERGDSMFGKFSQDAMYETDGDICIMLCDDDSLCQDYLANLNGYYSNPLNADVNYSYSHLMPYDPEASFYNSMDLRDIKCTPFYLNRLDTVLPQNRLDASQISWRVKEAKEIPIKFPYPQTTDIDAYLYGQMGLAWGGCRFNGFMGQYKGWYKDQLGKRGFGGGRSPWK